MLRPEISSFAVFEISTLLYGVYLLIEEFELDYVLPFGPIHIFILLGKVDECYLLFFMEEVDTYLSEGYKLVIYCPCYEIGFTSSEELESIMLDMTLDGEYKIGDFLL